MALSFGPTGPLRSGRPVILVGVELPLPDSTARTRTMVREVAAAGFGAIWLSAPTAPQATVAKDTARRAGLAVLVEAEGLPAEPHVVRADRESGWCCVATPEAAFEALFGGAPVIYGPVEAVTGVQRYLELCDAAALWERLEAPEGWLRRGAGEEWGGYTAQAARLEFASSAESEVALHWVDPQDGEVLGLLLVAPAETHRLNPPAAAVAVYVGPKRYRADESLTRPVQS